MATIKEIANLAGVSRGTVDRVLKQRGRVKKETAEKIKQIAAELDYKPNKIAQALVAKKNNTKIGVILFGSENKFFDEVISGIEDAEKDLNDYGCSIKITNCYSADVDSQLKAIDDMVKENINGIVMAPIDDSRISKKIDELNNNNIPVVTVNTDIHKTTRVGYIGSNYSAAGKTAGALMIMLTGGKANVGIVSGYNNIKCHVARVTGFTDKIKANAPNINIVETVNNYDDDFKSYNVTKELLTNHPEINGLYISSSGIYGACRAIIDLNLENSICVITHDDYPQIKEMINKGVINATICQEPYRQGNESIKMMFDYLMYNSVPSHKHVYTENIIKIKENI